MRNRFCMACLFTFVFWAPALLASPVVATASAPHVAQSTFTTKVVAREPVDNITTLSTSANRVYYFTDLRNMTGQTVIQRFEYKGKVMSQMAFKVGGPRWRVFSLQVLDPAHTGEWKASVINAQGVTLAVNTFEYLPATSGAAATQVNQKQ